MKLSLGINPNCSEAVFRFYTHDLKVMKRILKAFADYSHERLDVDLKAPQDVNSVTWSACNGEGECIWEPHLDAFVVRVGNNDLSDSGDALKVLLEELGIPAEEAETSPLLSSAYARDCTCGCVFLDGYRGLIKQPEPPENPDDPKRNR